MITQKGVQPPEQEELNRFEKEYPALGRWFRLVYGGFANIATYSQELAPASVAANTTAEQTFTVNGLSTNDVVIVNKPSLNAGIGIAGARVSAANTLAITYVNSSGGAVVPTTETYTIISIRL
jgi:hypothetical protein